MKGNNRFLNVFSMTEAPVFNEVSSGFALRLRKLPTPRRTSLESLATCTLCLTDLPQNSNAKKDPFFNAIRRKMFSHIKRKLVFISKTFANTSLSKPQAVAPTPCPTVSKYALWL